MDQGPTTPTSGARPRPRSRGFSYGSNRSGGSKDKTEYFESPKDKAKRDSLWKGLSKANPNAAIIEDAPAVANVLEESTLQNLREMHHKDAFGNDIVDPDRSNPTRPRMERPLDTIRNFERAIDDGYKRRSSYKNEASEAQFDRNNEYASRRSSYFGGEYALSNKRQSVANRPAGYGNGPNPNGQYQGNGGGYYGNQGGYYGNNRGHPQRQRYGDRMQSDPQMYGQQQQRPYRQHDYHQSYDTVNTGVTNGSDSTGPWANSTDPSSENSSLDRVAANKPQTPGEPYGQYPQNGYNGHNGPIMEDEVYGEYWQQQQQDGYGPQNGGYQQNGYGHPDPQVQSSHQAQISSPRDIYQRHNSAPMPPQPPPHAANGGRRPMPLNAPPPANGGYGANNMANSRPQQPEKRKSWLARRFSKKD